MLDLTGTFAIGPVFQGLNPQNPTALTSYGGAPLGAPMGYYTGFLPSTAGQTSQGPSLLSSIATGLETFLPSLGSLFGARTPPLLPGGGGASVPAVGTTVTQTPGQHPVLDKLKAPAAVGTAIVGTAAATMGGVALQRAMGGGARRARYAPAGTPGYHMIKKGPHAGMWARNRHRNVANIRALRRALSRAHGFERICKKVYHFAHRKPGGSGFKRRKRSR